MPIRAVAFDVDGTLYPNAAMYLRSAPFVLLRLRLMRAFAAVRREIRKRRPIDDLRTMEAQMLAERLGVSEREARERIDKEIYGLWEQVLDGVSPYPYVKDCIQGIKDAGLPIAVTSDFPVGRKLARLGLDGLFDCQMWTEEAGYLKPHPESFHMIAECLGVPPEQILYVGNSYEYDVVGAKKAGLYAAHRVRRPVTDTIADFTFSDYRDLQRWIHERKATVS